MQITGFAKRRKASFIKISKPRMVSGKFEQFARNQDSCSSSSHTSEVLPSSV